MTPFKFWIYRWRGAALSAGNLAHIPNSPASHRAFLLSGQSQIAHYLFRSGQCRRSCCQSSIMPIIPITGSGLNSHPVGFIIKRYIARNHRSVQYLTGFAHASYRPDNLGHDILFFRIAEIQIIGHRQRFCTACADIAIASHTACLPPSKASAST